MGNQDIGQPSSVLSLPVRIMTTLADDLLKTRPIADLRVRIKQLNKDADDKKTELRSMVGSQYHQFIQSADKISEMYDQSKLLISSLDLFWEKNQEFVGQMQTFLNKDAQKQQQQREKAVKNIQKQGRVSISDVNSSELWKDIGDCDLYNASMRLMIASAVLAKHAPVSTNVTFLRSYLNEQAQNNIANLEVSEREILDFKSCFFLKDTVMDDARMVCNGGADDIYTEGILEEKAKTFAVLQTLRQLIGAEDAPLDLLDMFLANASRQLEHLFEKHLVFTNKSESIEFGMLSLIRFLQQLVLDVHVLFFEPFSVAGDQSPHFHNGLIHYYLASLQREVHVKLAAATSDINTTVTTITTANMTENLHKVRSWLKQHLKMVTDRASAILSSLASAAQVAQLQQHVFAACTSPLLLTTASAGTCIHASTTQKLNISWVKVWLEANQLFFATSAPSVQVLKRLSSKPTEVEKRPKLVGKQDVKEVMEDSTAEVVDTNLLLWTRVFRVSFLHQVERLLQKACEDIFQDISSAIQVTLAQQFGLQIMFSPSVNSGGNSGLDAMGTHLLPLKMVLKPWLDVSSTENKHKVNWALRLTQGLSSSELCLLVERIRHRLDSQLLTLLDDVITPVQQQEQQQSTISDTSSAALSGTALMEALQANCCRLLGQLSAFLRQILEQLRLQLPEITAASLLGVPVTHKPTSETPLFVQCLYQHFLSSTSQINCAKLTTLPSSISSEFNATSSNDTTSSSAASATSTAVSAEYVNQRMMCLSALFVGRLAWLLRTHEHARFTRSALLFSSSNPTSATTSNAASFSQVTGGILRVSEEQCRSAFEISDTDGDGVIHLYEAIDALRALCVGDREADILRLFHAHHHYQAHSHQNTPGKHAFTEDEEHDEATKDLERFVSTTDKKKTMLDDGTNEDTMSHNVSFVRHSTQIIPSPIYHAPSLTELHNVTYEEFLLICGPALQVSGQELQCLTRFHRALDHLIVFSHMLYLSVTMTNPVLAQMCQRMGQEIGLGHSRFTWRVHELELEQGASENIWLPGHTTSALATYLQDTSIQVNQDVTSADSLMSIASEVLFPPKDIMPKSQDDDNDDDEDHDLPMLSSLSALLTPIPSVSKINKANNLKTNTEDFATTMSKTVSLHRLIQKWSREVQSHLLLDVYQVWVREVLMKTRPQTISMENKDRSSFLNQEEIRLFGPTLATSASTKAQQQQVLDDACMQTMVDVRVLRMLTNHAAAVKPSHKLGQQDGLVSEEDAIHRQYVQLTEEVERLMDPITLELTKSLVTEEVVPRIVDQSRLFTLLSAPGHLLYKQKQQASTHAMTAMSAVGQERHTTDSLLAQLFADGAHSNNGNNNHTYVPRLALLPMALPTGTSPKPSTGTSTPVVTGAATVKPLQQASTHASNNKPVSSGVKWW